MKKVNSMEQTHRRSRLYGNLWTLGLLFTFLAAWMSSASAAEALLGLDDYLTQVEEKNQGLKSARTLSEGAGLRSVEGRLLLSPQLFGNFQLSEDRRETVNPSFQGSKNKVNSYSLGVSQDTSFGLQARLYYNLINTQIIGVNPTFVPQPKFFEGRPVLELTQSLWRNGFGSEVRQRQEQLEAQALATSYQQSYRAKEIRAEAENAYWNLTLLRDVVRVQRESLARFERMRDIYQRRSGLGLSDRADLLQSRAAVNSRKLELQQAIDQELEASRLFNTLRGVDADTVAETLRPIEATKMRELVVPVRTGMREDLKAAQQEQRAAVAAAKIGREQNSPNLELFATLSLNGRDPTSSEAMSESLTGQHPWNSVGLRFTAPLDIGKISKSREGYRLTGVAADMKYQRTLFEQDREWNDLSRQVAEAKERLELARELEATQKEKLDYERTRHSRGRTTTFQVLTFEQDYANAQLAHIQAQATVLQLIAQMKTFGGTP